MSSILHFHGPSTLITPCGSRGVDVAEPELAEERAELMCAKNAEPLRGVDRGLSILVPESGRLAEGRFNVGTVRSCVSGILTFLCFGGLLPMRTLRGIPRPEPSVAAPGAVGGAEVCWIIPGLIFVGSGFGGRSGDVSCSVSGTRGPSPSPSSRDSIVSRCISAVAGELMLCAIAGYRWKIFA